MTKHLTTAQIVSLLQQVIEMSVQIHNQHELEIATCARLLREKDERIAYLEAQTIDLLNLTVKE